MEPKEIKIERAMYRFYHKVGLWLMLLLLVALVLLELTSCRSTTAAYGTQRTIRDSVVVKYKTVIRDSLRVKDSTVVSYSTVQRDSIVLKVDKITGEVLSKDTWHWKDTDKDRSHITDVRNMAEKGDSVASTASKSDKRIFFRRVKQKKPSEVKKTRYWKTYWLGMLSGVLLSFGWKYRKTIVGLLKKITGFL